MSLAKDQEEGRTAFTTHLLFPPFSQRWRDTGSGSEQ